MFLHIWAISHGEAVDIHLLDDPALHERVEAIINCCHGNVGHPFLCPHENLLSGGMIAFLKHDAVDVLALGSRAEPTAGEPFPELFCMDTILHKGTVAQEPPKSIVGIILNLNKPCKPFMCRNRPPPYERTHLNHMVPPCKRIFQGKGCLSWNLAAAAVGCSAKDCHRF